MTFASILAKLGIIASSGDVSLKHAVQEHRVAMDRARRIGGDIARGDDHGEQVQRRLSAIDEAFRKVPKRDR